jgi:ribosomal subunit interface protein
MTKLPIHITAHHLVIDDALRAFVLNKVGGLRRFTKDALAAEVVLRREAELSLRFSAVARVSLPGRDLNARADSTTIYGAIQRLVVKLVRLAGKRKTRFLQTTSRAGNRTIRFCFDPRYSL